MSEAAPTPESVAKPVANTEADETAATKVANRHLQCRPPALPTGNTSNFVIQTCVYIMKP